MPTFRATRSGRRARTLAAALVLALALGAAGAGAASADDPLDTPAQPSPLAARGLITALAPVGDGGLVAVGQRGHILRSNDGGRRWTQAAVPVSSDLTAVQFVDARVGYATGHDGVVLRSDDGGATWTRVLDGRAANQLALAALRAKVDAAGAQAADADRKLLDEARRNVALGPDKPFLDLWFQSRDEGFVVGAYNLIFHTRDGGRHWESWFDRTDNPKLFNLYAIRPAQGSLFIAGEAGLLLRLDPAAGRFRALASPYAGSFFGLVGTSAGALAFGMRGHAFLSRDQGQSWQAVRTGLMASLTAGAARPDGSVVLVDLAGGAARSVDGGLDFARVGVPQPMPLTAVALLPHAVVLGGLRGLRALDDREER